MTARPMRLALAAAFVATVFGANWALDRYGIVPIGFGLMAPAGVYFAGLGFTLRDALHEAGGRRWVLASIVIGAAASYLIAPNFAVASGVAFALGELADLLVYEPLRERQWTAAVIVSGLVGAAVDSAVFLHLAFHSLDHLDGQIVGKAYMVALALPIAAFVRRRQRAVA